MEGSGAFIPFDGGNLKGTPFRSAVNAQALATSQMIALCPASGLHGTPHVREILDPMPEGN